MSKLLKVMIYFVLVIKLGAVTEEELIAMPKGRLLLRMAKKFRLMKDNSAYAQAEDIEHVEIEKVLERQKEKEEGQSDGKKAFLKKDDISEEDEDFWLDD